MSFTFRHTTDEPKWPAEDYYPYSFLHTELNALQFYDAKVLQPFMEKLQHAHEKKVRVLYIGDSHVQADGFTNEVRERLQQTFGYGGRGMVFPYSTARTHAAVDYTTEHTGRWLYAKNVEQFPELPLGISGVSSRTTDSNATFKLHFRNSIRPEFRKIRIYCKKGPESYDLKVKALNEELPVTVYNRESPGGNGEQVVEVMLSQGANDIGFYLVKNDGSQKQFELYGISIENPDDRGVLFHSVGINGAGHYSVLRENLLESQLPLLNPDLVVLDLGANDFYRGGINRAEYTANLEKIVARIRSASPQAAIMLSCSQDIYRGGFSIPDCAVFSEIIRDFARDHQCAFYDWYWIAGGRFSMLKWNASLLSSWDLVHLNGTGYKLKGQLITQAFHRTYDWYLNRDTQTRLIYPLDSLLNPKPDTSQKVASSVLVQPQIRYQWIYHRVTRGQNIWGIASWYGVSAYQIKVWNGLRTNYLWIGQVLKIYAPVKVNVNPPVNNTPAPKPTPAPQPAKPATPPVKTNPVPVKPVPKPVPKPVAVYHKVKTGETLFGIARKYGTSTSSIMKLNNLRTHTIKSGQVLRVK
ncbi:MAG: LysM peptidoglycan-binding domain-containing protein [Bacteroidetes bacterium]|nr:LysM peptidoglycan-binding domain-containing protein [Bacteroidota bacterium]